LAQSLIHISLLVKDYDDAIDFYVNKLNFTLVEDTRLSDKKRWVLVQPRASSGCCILFAKADNIQQELAIGNQSGGRVFLFLHTDNFERDYNQMVARGIEFIRKPINEHYGIVAVFKDLYGNLWDLIQHHKS
jgi:catechol 2,3-dioxygenase-like lactoylglutathione lyase family enzyme